MNFFEDLTAYLIKRRASKNVQDGNIKEQVDQLFKTINALNDINANGSKSVPYENNELINKLSSNLDQYYGKDSEQGVFREIAEFANRCLHLFNKRREGVESEFNNPAHLLFYEVFVAKRRTELKDTEFESQIVGSPGFTNLYLKEIGPERGDDAFDECMRDAPKLYITIVVGLYHLSGFRPKETEITSLEDLKKWQERFKNYSLSQGEVWYRGQSNSQWGLIPSCHRGIDRSDTTVLVTDDLLEQWYENYYINDKLANTAFEGLVNKDKYIFMQHAVSFSPFIDFTSDIEVALSFSMSNHTSYHEFENTDAAIYVLKVKEECTANPSIVKTINILMNTNTRWSLSDFVYFLFGMIIEPDVVTFDLGNNDRMKYQDGKLLLINNVVVLDHEYDLSRLLRHFHIEKLVIKAEAKRELLSAFDVLSKSKSLQNLMDPYNFLNIR